VDLRRTPANPGDLHADALAAEDIAIRYADSRNAPHSGHFQGFAAYDDTTKACMTAVFGAVARKHNVSIDDVRSAVARRPLAPDAIVALVFAVVYCLVAYRVALAVRQNFPVDGGTEAVVATAAVVGMSVVVSFIAVLVGEWFAIAVEMVRMGNGHLSNRTDRVPWTHHHVSFFLVGAVLFWLIAAFCYRAGRSQPVGRPWRRSDASRPRPRNWRRGEP
jgi:hypothetical protein